MSERLPGIRPQQTLWRRLDAASRTAFPAACTALLLLALAAPFRMPGQAQLQPAVALACVFFWSLFRPSSMSPPVVFALGLLLDLVSLQSPGVSVLVLLLVHGLAVRWRVLAGQGFLVVWLAFVLVAAGAALVAYVLSCGLMLRLLPVQSMLFQFGLAAGLYPALAWAFTLAHRGLANPEGA